MPCQIGLLLGLGLLGPKQVGLLLGLGLLGPKQIGLLLGLGLLACSGSGFGGKPPPRDKEARDLKKGRWMCKKEQKYTATGLPMWSPTIVLTGLDHA